MTSFRKKPVVIEAYQLPPAGEDVPDSFHEWCQRVGFTNFTSERDETLAIETLEGTMTAQPGDWIIRGVKGEFYPCKPDIFAATYEPAEASTDPKPQPSEAALKCAREFLEAMGKQTKAQRNHGPSTEIKLAEFIAAHAANMAEALKWIHQIVYEGVRNQETNYGDYEEIEVTARNALGIVPDDGCEGIKSIRSQLVAAQAENAALRAKIVTLRDALEAVRDELDHVDEGPHISRAWTEANTALASTAEFSGQTVISKERLADLEQDAKRLDGYQSILRRALGAGTRERHLSCDVHLGKSIRDAIDTAMAQTEGGQP